MGIWRIEAPLGRGRPRVYRAVNPEDPRLRAAVKPLDGGHPSWELVRERLLRDARALLDLRHAHLAGVRGLRLHGPFPCIEMDWVDGEPLSARLPGAPVPPAQVRAWLEHLAGALTALHRAGLRHRDIKPDNLLITAEEQLVLVDLGLPWSADPPEDRDLIWVPPEWLGEEVGGDLALWDLYSAGVVTWALLTGRLPFVEEQGLAPAARRAARQALGPLDPGPEQPVALRALVRELTWPEPQRRVSSAALLLDRVLRLDLERVEPERVFGPTDSVELGLVEQGAGGSELLSVERPGWGPRSAEPPAAPTWAPPALEPLAPGQRPPGVWAALGVALLLLLLVSLLQAL